MGKKALSFSLTNVQFGVTDRSNWFPFSGTCLFTDIPSDGVPSGWIDKPVEFPKEEVQKALDSMVDMGVNCEFPDDYYDDTTSVFAGHNSRFKIGVVKTSTLNEDEMVISGGLWDMDFWDVCYVFKNAKSSLGFSVEVLFDADDAGDHYVAKDVEFTGVAILFKDLAAFKKTYIAAKDKNKSKGGNLQMNKEELQAMLDALLGKFEAKFGELKAAQEKNNTQIEQLAVAFAEEREEAKAKLEAEAKAAEEAAKKAEEEKAAAEAAEKAKAELEAKQKKEAEELEIQRKSVAFTRIKPRFEGTNEKQKAILSDSSLSASEKFQQLTALREQELSK